MSSASAWAACSPALMTSWSRRRPNGLRTVPMPDRPESGEVEWLTEVGIRVRIARFRLRITQTEMARRAAVSRVTLGSIERGEHAATAPTYRRIATATGLQLGE